MSDERLIAALINCASIREAAAITGMGERTIYRRLCAPEFREKYEQSRQQIVTNACLALQRHMGEAIETITAMMDDTTLPAAVRLRAARSILEYGLRAFELTNIIPRLEALEAAETGGLWQGRGI